MSITIRWKHDHCYRGKSYKAGELSEVDPSTYQTLVKAWLWAEKHVVVEPLPEPPVPVAPVVETAALEDPEDDPTAETTALFHGGKRPRGRPRKNFED